MLSSFSYSEIFSNLNRLCFRVRTVACKSRFIIGFIRRFNRSYTYFDCVHLYNIDDDQYNCVCVHARVSERKRENNFVPIMERIKKKNESKIESRAKRKKSEEIIFSDQ